MLLKIFLNWKFEKKEKEFRMVEKFEFIGINSYKENKGKLVYVRSVKVVFLDLI